MSRITVRVRWRRNEGADAKPKNEVLDLAAYGGLTAEQLAAVECVELGAHCPTCATWRPLDPTQQQLVLVAGARGHEVEWRGQSRGGRR